MKKIFYIVILSSILSITGCATEVPNHPVVIQKNEAVTMKPIEQFPSTESLSQQKPVMATTPKCPNGKKGYKCRHPKKTAINVASSQSTQATSTKTTTVPNPSYRFESGAIVEIREVSTTKDTLTVKNVSLLQNKRGDLILSKGMVLKMQCNANYTATLNYINGKIFSIPVVIQNNDHNLTGCDKSFGAIKYMQIMANII